jgi:hypothetical protein
MYQEVEEEEEGGGVQPGRPKPPLKHTENTTESRNILFIKTEPYRLPRHTALRADGTRQTQTLKCKV